MQGNVMQHEIRRFARRIVALSLLALAIVLVFAAPASARDPARFDRNGEPRSERAQWVYRIVAKWGGHVQEAYRTDPRRWADSMGPAFARAPLPALRKAAEARSFAAMNDALLAASAPAAALAPTGGAKALGDPDRDLVYVPVTPCRILDTRIVGGPIPANSFRDFDLTDVVRFAPQGGDTSNCNVGDKGSFAAAALNITVVTPNMAGYITAFPYLASQPTAATINYVAGDIRNGLAIVRLDQTSAAYEFSVYSFAQTHLVADIVGYFREPEATALECVTVSSAQTFGRGDVTVDSPACPVGYAIVSGSCDSNASIYKSITGNSGHKCGTWYPAQPSANLYIIAHARCCRIPGR
jgi:hypothetical protein